MEFIFPKSNVMPRLVSSTVNFWTAQLLTFSTKATLLLLCWSHCYTNIQSSSRTSWLLRIYISKITMDLFPLCRLVLSSINEATFTWLCYLHGVCPIRNSNCLPFASTWVHSHFYCVSVVLIFLVFCVMFLLWFTSVCVLIAQCCLCL